MEDFRELNVGDVCFVRVRVSAVRKVDFDTSSYGIAEFATIDESGTSLMDFSFSLAPCERDSILSADDLQDEVKPKPKHAAYRRFREGDKVRVVDRDGRSWWLLDPRTTITSDGVYTVLENESEVIAGGYGELRIAGADREYEVPFYFLELVTPVEEIPTYRVGDFPTNGEICVWRDQGGKTEKICSFNVNTHPNAKEAAEAECKRLNDEWQTKVCRSEDGKEGNNEPDC